MSAVKYSRKRKKGKKKKKKVLFGHREGGVRPNSMKKKKKTRTTTKNPEGEKDIQEGCKRDGKKGPLNIPKRPLHDWGCASSRKKKEKEWGLRLRYGKSLLWGDRGEKQEVMDFSP